MNTKYKTKQKEKILDVIKAQNGEFSIDEIYHILDRKVGLTTIYRSINELIVSGKLTKIIKEHNCAYYQYLVSCDKDNHFYLKCNICGKIQHVDCDCIRELSEHIQRHHSFEIDNNKTILNGICNECKGE